MKYATCHPERQHEAIGLCLACYQKVKYQRRKEQYKAARRARYKGSSEAQRIRSRAYYYAHREDCITKATERNRRYRNEGRSWTKPVWRPKVKLEPEVRETPKDFADKEWWKMPKPPHWYLEAGQEVPEVVLKNRSTKRHRVYPLIRKEHRGKKESPKLKNVPWIFPEKRTKSEFGKYAPLGLPGSRGTMNGHPLHSHCTYL